MYDVSPERIFVLRHALDSPACVERMDRMLAAMGRERSSVEVLEPEQLPDTIRERGWVADTRQGALGTLPDPDIVFNAFTWPTKEEKARLLDSQLYKDCLGAFRSGGGSVSYGVASRTQALLGCTSYYHYEQRPEWKAEHVCWSLHDIHSAWGCFHRCAYCSRGTLYVIMLNVEEFIHHVDQLLEANPWQKVIRYDVEQDCLPLEPEYGASAMLVDHFAQMPDRYLILFSKSANVDFLLPLDHRGHTIMLWTLTSDQVSRELEERTGTMLERLEAARKCQEAGYTVRFKFKPIIPLRGWREQHTEMLEAIFDHVEPDNLSMELLFTQGGVAELDSVIGLSAIDPDFVAACIEAEKQPWTRVEHGPRPFTFEVKREVYRHILTEARRLSPATPVTLCAETQRMWAACQDLINGRPWDYACNCSPHCTPGLRRLERVEGPDAARVAAAVAAGRIPPEPPDA